MKWNGLETLVTDHSSRVGRHGLVGLWAVYKDSSMGKWYRVLPASIPVSERYHRL